MPRHRRHRIEFKRQVVAEYEAGESTHGLGRRYDVARSLIRIWIEKAGAGQLDQDRRPPTCSSPTRRGSPRWSGWSASRRWS